jgi:hypothetical protein
VFVAFVIEAVNCNLADLLRPGAGSSKGTTEIAKHLARLSRKITMTNELAVYVFGLLTRDEYKLASRRDDDLGVRFRSRQIIGIDAFERHRLWVYLGRG